MKLSQLFCWCRKEPVIPVGAPLPGTDAPRASIERHAARIQLLGATSSSEATPQLGPRVQIVAPEPLKATTMPPGSPPPPISALTSPQFARGLSSASGAATGSHTPNPPSSIIEGKLYLGPNHGSIQRKNPDGYTHIVRVLAKKETAYTGVPADNVFYIDAFDVVKDIDEADQETAIAFIHNALTSDTPGKVYVHCTYGEQRSAFVVLSYLQRYGVDETGKPLTCLKEAYDYLKEKRPVVGEFGDFSYHFINLAKRKKAAAKIQTSVRSHLLPPKTTP